MWNGIWNLLTPYRKHYRTYLAGIALRQTLAAGSGFLLVYALRYTLGRESTAAEWALLAAFLMSDLILLALDTGLNSFFAARLGYPLFGHLRSQALGKVFELPLEWHQRQTSGALAGRVNQGVGKVVQTAESISRELIPALIQTTLTIVPLLLLSTITAPITIVALAIFLWLTVMENRERLPLRRARYESYNRDSGFFTECVQSVQPVIQFGQERRMLHQYDRLQDEIITTGLEETRICAAYSARRSLVLTITKRLCQAVWFWQFRHNALDAALVLYLNSLVDQLLGSFWSYSSLLDRLGEGIEPARLLVEFLDENPAIQQIADASLVRVPDRIGIEMSGVHFAYSSGSDVIRDFHLTIAPGSIVGVAGRSGCGKTTLQSLLTRLFDIKRGEILVAGTGIERWPLNQLRGLFAHVSQSGGVFFSETTLLEVLRFGRPTATREEVMAAAKAACIHDDIERMPLNYATPIGERGVTLSRGQQQRIALAQAIISLDASRKVLILDEFTSALDSETERRILENIRPMLAGRTVIIIAHRLSTIRDIADKIVVLDRGGIAEHGTHEELLARGGWYADMSRIQAA